MKLRSGNSADKTYIKRVYTRKTIPTISSKLPIIMSLDETINAVRENTSLVCIRSGDEYRLLFKQLFIAARQTIN